MRDELVGPIGELLSVGNEGRLVSERLPDLLPELPQPARDPLRTHEVPELVEGRARRPRIAGLASLGRRGGPGGG